MQAWVGGDVQPSRDSARAMYPAYADGSGQRQDRRFNARLSDLGAIPPLFLAAAAA